MHKFAAMSALVMSLLLLGCASRGETRTTYDESKEARTTEHERAPEPPKVKADDWERREHAD